MLLVSIIILGAFLRFFMIGQESFWVDEATTALSIKTYNFNDLVNNFYTKGQILPEYLNSNLDFPVYYLSLEIWSNIFGVSESTLRSFSAIFGVFSIILVYLLSKELFNEKTGLIASFIFSLHLIMIEYSQEARLYSFIICIALLSSYSLIKSINTKNNKFLVLFGISNLIGIYTSPIFLFFFAFEALYLSYLAIADFIKREKIITSLHFVFVALAIAYIPLIYRMLHPTIIGLRYSGQMSIQGLAKIFLQYNSWLHPSEELLVKISGMNLLSMTFYEWAAIISVITVFLILAIFFIFSLFNFKAKEKKSLIFLLSFLIVPFVIFFAMLYKVISIFPSNKYVIYTVPAYLIAAAFGMSKLRRRNLTIILAAFLLASIAPLCFYYSNQIHPEYREAASFLEQNAGNDPIFAAVPTIKIAFDYYSGDVGNVYPVLKVEDVKLSNKNSKSAWLVLSTKYADQNGEIRQYFEKNYKIAGTKEFYDVKAVHYVK